MSDLSFVFQRVELGDRIKFFHDFYGRQWIELSRGWLLKRRTRVYLAAEEILEVKKALERRRRSRSSEAAQT